MVYPSNIRMWSLLYDVILHLFHKNNYTVHYFYCFSVILNVTDNRPKTRYILALDDSHNTFQEIVKAISLGLGPGRIENVPKEDALLNREITVRKKPFM